MTAKTRTRTGLVQYLLEKSQMKRRANGSTSFMTVKSKRYVLLPLCFYTVLVHWSLVGYIGQAHAVWRYLKVKPRVVFALSSGTTENDDSVNDERTTMRPSSPWQVCMAWCWCFPLFHNFNWSRFLWYQGSHGWFRYAVLLGLLWNLTFYSLWFLQIWIILTRRNAAEDDRRGHEMSSYYESDKQ